MALVGGVLLWAAFPPLDLWPLAWVAPIPWLYLVRIQSLPGGRSYGGIYLAGFLHWLLILQGIRHAHWATYIGWVAMCVYLGVFLPVFIGVARIAVHRVRVPLIIAAPVVWTGLEYARGFLLSGFSMAVLGHTQYRWLAIIQVSDLAGAYAVTFVVMFVAACLARMWPLRSQNAAVAWWPLLPAFGLLAAAAGLRCLADRQPAGCPARGGVRAGRPDPGVDRHPVRRRSGPSPTHLRTLSATVAGGGKRAQERGPDRLARGRVWHAAAHLRSGSPPPPGTGQTQADVGHWQRKTEQMFRDRAWLTVNHYLKTPAIVGTESIHFGQEKLRFFNSAVWIDGQGKVAGRYDKMHPVLFGEYVPLGDVFPWLYRLTPMAGGLTAGKAPQVFEAAGLRWSPCICFENTVPHLVRRQVVELSRRGTPPDVLVTLTNDGWFWGSSMLDLHFMCGVFRAVELRKPMLIAANTGFSAWIDADGRIRAKGPRRAKGIVLADVCPDSRNSLYQWWGDGPAACCLGLVVFVIAWDVWARRRGRRPPYAGQDQNRPAGGP